LNQEYKKHITNKKNENELKQDLKLLN
jgi:hypothetical protein